MVKEDLIWAIKNAMERGESIELAKISLLNAGYNSQDVEEAAEKIQETQKKFSLKIPFFNK
ncbi:hypothetical protein J4465_01035 [Candidatus Pacearchaeota archaeon]|nr:hypothetical protein [Candidatus Pacearchaeota archaeon]